MIEVQIVQFVSVCPDQGVSSRWRSIVRRVLVKQKLQQQQQQLDGKVVVDAGDSMTDPRSDKGGYDRQISLEKKRMKEVCLVRIDELHCRN